VLRRDVEINIMLSYRNLPLLLLSFQIEEDNGV